MPASIGSIPTDANQEDFVPMGMAAACKAQRILANAQRVVGRRAPVRGAGARVPQAASRRGGASGACISRLRGLSRRCPLLEADRPPAPDLERLARAVADGELDPGAD